MRKTAFDWTDNDNIAYFTSNEQKWVNKLLRYADERPDEVRVLQRPENNGGYLMASVPKSWCRVTPPAKRTMTDEQRQAASERMKNMRKNRVWTLIRVFLHTHIVSLKSQRIL